MLTLFLALLWATAEAIVIDPHNSIWVLDPIDVGYGARTPVALALRDATHDWYKVLGRPPPIVTVADNAGADALPPGFAGTAVYFGKAAEAFAPSPSGGLVGEAHALVVQQTSGGPTIIAAVGSADEMRSSVFSIYAF